MSSCIADAAEKLATTFLKTRSYLVLLMNVYEVAFDNLCINCIDTTVLLNGRLVGAAEDGE